MGTLCRVDERVFCILININPVAHKSYDDFVYVFFFSDYIRALVSFGIAESMIIAFVGKPINIDHYKHPSLIKLFATASGSR